MAYELLRPVEGDWEQVRDLRLRALKDTPIAYGERYEDAVGLDEAEWRTRAARGDAQDSVQVVARLTDGEAAGRWVGTMAAFVSRGLPPYVPGVGVGPAAPAAPPRTRPGAPRPPAPRGRARRRTARN